MKKNDMMLHEKELRILVTNVINAELRKKKLNQIYPHEILQDLQYATFTHSILKELKKEIKSNTSQEQDLNINNSKLKLNLINNFIQRIEIRFPELRRGIACQYEPDTKSTNQN